MTRPTKKELIETAEITGWVILGMLALFVLVVLAGQRVLP